MTFIASVLTNSDLNNTNTTNNGTSYIGTGTITTGYNTIYVTLTSTTNSAAGGLEIQFSADNSAWKTYYTDTYFTGTLFSKSYTIVGKYWRVKYSTLSATFTINSRLSTTVESGPRGIDNFYSNPSDSYHDAFGKLRTSTPYTVIDNKFPFAATGTSEFLSNTREDCSLTVGTGATGVYGNSQCKITVTSGPTGSSSFTSQSRKYAIYQPGKSLLFLASGIIKYVSPITPSQNYTARIGYFDNNNGLFFEQNYTSIGVVLRNLTSEPELFNRTGISINLTEPELVE
jgi:hypothetical protein